MLQEFERDGAGQRCRADDGGGHRTGTDASRRRHRNIVDYNALVAPLSGQVIGRIAAPLSNSANAAGEMPAGDAIADAQLQATQPATLGGAVVAFMNASGVRNGGIPIAGSAPSYPHDITYGDAFNAQPFGNTLATLTLTAQQLKNLLEQQFVGCLGQTARRFASRATATSDWPM